MKNISPVQEVPHRVGWGGVRPVGCVLLCCRCCVLAPGIPTERRSRLPAPCWEIVHFRSIQLSLGDSRRVTRCYTTPGPTLPRPGRSSPSRVGRRGPVLLPVEVLLHAREGQPPVDAGLGRTRDKVCRFWREKKITKKTTTTTTTTTTNTARTSPTTATGLVSAITAAASSAKGTRLHENCPTNPATTGPLLVHMADVALAPPVEQRTCNGTVQQPVDAQETHDRRGEETRDRRAPAEGC